jgi:hypothetical protein
VIQVCIKSIYVLTELELENGEEWGKASPWVKAVYKGLKPNESQ